MYRWLNQGIEGACVNIEQYAEDLLAELKDFLFLGTVPVGNLIEHFVWITRDFRFPVELLELPEIRYSTREDSEVLLYGRDFELDSDRKTVRFLRDISDAPRIGEYYLFYIPRARAVDTNLWGSYGSKLTDLFREDSEEYRLILESILAYFVLGPTSGGTERLFELPTGTDVKVYDYLTKPDWWVGKVLPDWLLESIEHLPVIGNNLKVGDFVVAHSEFSRLVLRRYCSPTELIYFGSTVARFGGREYNNKFYFYGGKSFGSIYMEKLGKYHIFSVEGSSEAFSILTSDNEVYKAFSRALMEGKVISSFPLISANHNETDVVDLKGLDSYSILTYIDLLESYSKQPKYGGNGLFYLREADWSDIYWNKTRSRYEKVIVRYYGEENLYFSFDSVDTVGPRTVSVSAEGSGWFMRKFFFNDNLSFGDKNVAYGGFYVGTIPLSHPIIHGERYIVKDDQQIERGTLMIDSLKILYYETIRIDRVIPLVTETNLSTGDNRSLEVVWEGLDRIVYVNKYDSTLFMVNMDIGTETSPSASSIPGIAPPVVSEEIQAAGTQRWWGILPSDLTVGLSTEMRSTVDIPISELPISASDSMYIPPLVYNFSAEVSAIAELDYLVVYH